MLWVSYFVTFNGGVFVGVMLMALIVGGSRDK